MKVQIRGSIFETNSSSMHSLVVSTKCGKYTEDEIYEEIWLDTDGKWEIWEREIQFGRAPFKLLYTFASKVQYALASLNGTDIKLSDVSQIIEKYAPKVNELKLPIVQEDDVGGWTDDDILPGALRELGISLEDFLTDRRYMVVVDGDEYCIWDSLKKSGVIDTSMIKEEIG